VRGRVCHFFSIFLWLFIVRSSGQSSWLQIQRSGFDSRLYQIIWEVVGLERGPLSLVSTIEKLLERKSSGSGLENREYGRRDPSRWPHGTLYPQKLATSPTTGGRSVDLVRLRSDAMEFFYGYLFDHFQNLFFCIISITFRKLCLFLSSSGEDMGSKGCLTQWPERQVIHLPPSSVNVKNSWRFTSDLTYIYIYIYICLRGLVKRSDTFFL
jgi:hypothetical protein